MPSKKTHRVQLTKTARNRSVRTFVRKRITKARQAINEQEGDVTEFARDAVRALDRAASKGVIHKNNAARRKSRLMRKLSATG